MAWPPFWMSSPRPETVWQELKRRAEPRERRARRMVVFVMGKDLRRGEDLSRELWGAGPRSILWRFGGGGDGDGAASDAAGRGAVAGRARVREGAVG